MRHRLKQIKRIRLIINILILAMVFLIIRMSSLTIAKGDYYRVISENLSIKDVYISAPRGEIRDRNGISLASNRPTFVLQIIKEEFYKLDNPEKNEVMAKAIRILDKEANTYNDSFAIELNKFAYDSNSDYLNNERTPLDEVVDIIVGKNLIKDILEIYYEEESANGTYRYLPIENVLNHLRQTSTTNPFVYTYSDGKIRLSFNEEVDISKWKSDNMIDENASPMDALISSFDDSEILARKILDHPVARLITYEILESRGLSDNISLIQLSNKYKEEYKSIKRDFMQVYPEINMDTTAKQDFLIIFESNNLVEFLSKNHENQEISTKDSIEFIYANSDTKPGFTIEENANEIIYKDANTSEILGPEIIAKKLIEDNKTQDLLDQGNNSAIAQSLMVDSGINPRISISQGYEYQPLRQLDAFNEKYSIPDGADDETIIEMLKNHYDLAHDISLYELIGVLSIYEEIQKSSELAYMPVNFSYDLKESTVALFSEQFKSYDCFNISLEPIRHYPNGTSAAHILGYMGKISQDSEIQKYVDEMGYSPDTLIGKTGIEESMQTYLYGKDGHRKIEVDPLGNTSEVIEEAKPIGGDNVYLSLDHKLQKRADLALENTLKSIRSGQVLESSWGDFTPVRSSYGRPYDAAYSGAVVVTDVNTGEILALSSYPAYDPNLFSTGISSADWESLMPEDESNPLAPRPLYNVASQTSIQPGSTFKMITALAALENGLDPEMEISCEGYIEIGDTKFGCWIYNQNGGSHGPMNLTDAIRDSCNYYFYSLALGYNQRTNQDLGVSVDIEDINKMAEKFGLGETTGLEINIPKETTSPRPDPNQKLQVQKSLLNRWLDTNIEDYYIGEGNLDESRQKEIIDEIVGLLDKEDLPTLKEVYDLLYSLDLDAGKQVSGKKDTLADLIKFSYINDSKWTIADTINITIGQGENQYNLIQMTNYAAAIANGGRLNELTLLDQIKDNDNIVQKFEKENNYTQIDIPSLEGLGAIQEGMRQASVSGLNSQVFSEFPTQVALKTGTAQRSGTNPQTGRDFDPFAYEIAYAPFDDPEIAIGVLLFEGGSGANCSPIVREIVAEYMGYYSDKKEDSLPIEMELIP